MISMCCKKKGILFSWDAHLWFQIPRGPGLTNYWFCATLIQISIFLPVWGDWRVLIISESIREHRHDDVFSTGTCKIMIRENKICIYTLMDPTANFYDLKRMASRLGSSMAHAKVKSVCENENILYIQSPSLPFAKTFFYHLSQGVGTNGGTFTI